jgi:hypothetical protein
MVVESAEEAAASISYPEDGGGRFLREVCYHTQNNVTQKAMRLFFTAMVTSEDLSFLLHIVSSVSNLSVEVAQ